MEGQETQAYDNVTEDCNCGFGYPREKKLSRFEYVFLTPHVSESTRFNVKPNSYLLSQKRQEIGRFKEKATVEKQGVHNGVTQKERVHLRSIPERTEVGDIRFERINDTGSGYHFKTKDEIIQRLLQRDSYE